MMTRLTSTIPRSFLPAILIIFHIAAVQPPAPGAESKWVSLFQGTAAAIPADLGSITEEYQGTGAKAVILIQDAHAIPEVQRNIQKMISYFENSYGIRWIGFEGGASRMRPELFRSFPDKEILSRVLDSYFSAGELTGPSAAAIMDNESAYFSGLENWELYQEGIRLYQKASPPPPSLLTALKKIKAGLETEKSEKYSPPLLKLDREWTRYTNDGTNLAEVLTTLKTFQKMPENRTLRALINAASPNQAEDTSFRLWLLKTVHRIKTSSAFQNRDNRSKAGFSQALQSFSNSEMAPYDFFDFLKEWVHASGNREWADAVSPPENFTPQLNLRKELSMTPGPEIMRALADHISGLKNELLRNPAEKELNSKSESFSLLERLVQLKLSKKDWEAVKQIDFHSVFPAIREDDLTADLAFYENAEQREAALFEHLMNGISHKDSPAAILVAGGFHTMGFVERLRQKRISYILIAPASKEFPSKNLYSEHMHGRVSWQSYYKTENGRINFGAAFTRALRDRLLSESKTSPCETAKRWKESLLSSAAASDEFKVYLDELPACSAPASADKEDSRIKDFLSRLRSMEKSNSLTPENILHLLSAAAVDPTASVLTNETFPEDLLLPLSPGRSELRSAASSSNPPAADFPVRDVRHELIFDSSIVPATQNYILTVLTTTSDHKVRSPRPFLVSGAAGVRLVFSLDDNAHITTAGNIITVYLKLTGYNYTSAEKVLRTDLEHLLPQIFFLLSRYAPPEDELTALRAQYEAEAKGHPDILHEPWDGPKANFFERFKGWIFGSFFLAAAITQEPPSSAIQHEDIPSAVNGSEINLSVPSDSSQASRSELRRAAKPGIAEVPPRAVLAPKEESISVSYDSFDALSDTEKRQALFSAAILETKLRGGTVPAADLGSAVKKASELGYENMNAAFHLWAPHPGSEVIAREEKKLLAFFQSRFPAAKLAIGLALPDPNREVPEELISSLSLFPLNFLAVSRAQNLAGIKSRLKVLISPLNLLKKSFVPDQEILPVAVLKEAPSNIKPMYLAVTAGEIENDQGGIVNHIHFLQILTAATASALLKESPDRYQDRKLLGAEVLRQLNTLFYTGAVRRDASGLKIDPVSVQIQMLMEARRQVAAAA